MKYIPRLTKTNVNRTPSSPLRDFALLLGGAGALLVVVYVFLGLLVDFMVPHISQNTEKKLGQYLQTKWQRSPDFPKQEEYLQALVGKIQGKCTNLPYQLDVDVVESETINALALPGGRMIILTGLLGSVRSENELAFVLGHEMGHFANRDHLSELGRGLVFMTLSVGVFGPNSSIGNQIGKLLHVSELSFSRKHESMADAYALDIQNCYYGHVAGATDFFEHIAGLEKIRFAGHYFSTHPDSRKRIANLDELARKKGYMQNYAKIPFSFTPPERKRKAPGD